MYTDLLTQIKNAQNAEKETLKAPYSKMNKGIADILEKNGFLKTAETKGRNPKKIIKIKLNKDHQIRGTKMISRPSLLKYTSYKDLKPVKGGHGILIMSTSKGLLTGKQAKKEKVGGQLLFEIW